MLKKFSFKKTFRKLLITFLLVFAFLFIFSAVANYIVIQKSREHLVTDIELLAKSNVGLVFGTSKYTRSGNENRHFYERLASASKLLKIGKINKIVLSGDKSSNYYNEPVQMRKELIKNNIDAKRIVMDFEGFSTYESIDRLKRVFGIKSATFISQKYHNYRIIFIARSFGIDAVAYNVGGDDSSFEFYVHIREYFARVKAVIDVYFFRTRLNF